MDDLISRQALRDAMYHEAFETDTEMQRWDSGCWIRYKLFENIIDNLPSAEPRTESQRESVQEELIKCKDCKHFEYDHPYIIQGIPILGHLVCNKWGNGCKTDENGYCFMAERRTDE